ncbi:MAG: alpha/beta hydrolase-fold protein [Pirellulales bacterium]
MWSTVEIAGKACDVYEPPTRNPQGFALIYLHGVHLQRLADHPAFEAEFAKHGLPVVCPWTARSWWTDRVCHEFDPTLTAERHILDNVLPWMGERWNARPPGIGIFGTSMGGQGALRFSFKYPNRFPVAVGISPAVDYWLRMKDSYDDPLWTMYDEPEAARQDSATLHIHPLNWPRNIWYCCDPIDHRWHESADRLRSKLGVLGIPQQYDLETSGGGHGFAYYDRMAPTAIGFLAERLAAESRRV